MSVHEIISRVSFSKQIGSGRWVCTCPAHDDNSPSLSVTEKENGKILLKCWAGCSNLDIITALGLSWDSLFPQNDGYSHSPVNPRRDDRIEDYIVEFAEYAKKTGKRLTVSDKHAYARALAKGGKPNDFVDKVIKEATK